METALKEQNTVEREASGQAGKQAYARARPSPSLTRIEYIREKYSRESEKADRRALDRRMRTRMLYKGGS
jgi:hypothetical protein